METDKDIKVATKNFVKAVAKKYTGKQVSGRGHIAMVTMSGCGLIRAVYPVDGQKERPIVTCGCSQWVWSMVINSYSLHSQSDLTNQQPGVTQGFGGFSDAHYAECYPG